METPIQELIEDLTLTVMATTGEKKEAYETVLSTLKVKLEQEKQMVIEAYNDSMLNCFSSSEKGLWKGDDYFKDKFQ